jgi:hypothetical protein
MTQQNPTTSAQTAMHVTIGVAFHCSRAHTARVGPVISVASATASCGKVSTSTSGVTFDVAFCVTSDVTFGLPRDVRGVITGPSEDADVSAFFRAL